MSSRDFPRPATPMPRAHPARMTARKVAAGERPLHSPLDCYPHGRGDRPGNVPGALRGREIRHKSHIPLRQRHFELAPWKTPATFKVMTLGEKLQSIRRECGLSQGAIGGQGFISAPGLDQAGKRTTFPQREAHPPARRLAGGGQTHPLFDGEGFARGNCSRSSTWGVPRCSCVSLPKPTPKTLPGASALLTPTAAAPKPKRVAPKPAKPRK